MMHCKFVQIVAMIFMASGATAWAQSPKELRTKVGVPVVLVNFLNARADCSTNPGPVAVPVVSGAPANGVIQMQITVTNVPASSKCPARKIPSTALIYAPNKDFSGADTVQIDVEVGNQKRSLSYRITVQAAGLQL
ncbi:MAG: hypothetical protein Q7T45_09785 [Bradyrhizobium sp.]|uniref:hypothetical protein n=1 Tax=Bradyrhizobium sp. TaxID=376 RepID=UPI0027197014|nr:hypothetical protein [Bradyrhizobium sp.]MDO8398097.1 hypothetical protein [Bradyrhizobium sp.]